MLSLWTASHWEQASLVCLHFLCQMCQLADCHFACVCVCVCMCAWVCACVCVRVHMCMYVWLCLCMLSLFLTLTHTMKGTHPHSALTTDQKFSVSKLACTQLSKLTSTQHTGTEKKWAICTLTKWPIAILLYCFVRYCLRYEGYSRLTWSHSFFSSSRRSCMYWSLSHRLRLVSSMFFMSSMRISICCFKSS